MAKKQTPTPEPTRTGTAREWQQRRNTIRSTTNDELDRLSRTTDPDEAATIRARLAVRPNELFLAVGAYEASSLLERCDRAKEKQHRADLWRARAEAERKKLEAMTDPDEREIQTGYIKLIETKADMLSRIAEAEMVWLRDLDGIVPDDPETWPAKIRTSAETARRSLLKAISETINHGTAKFRRATA